jgi:hypothetical protein
MGPWLVGVGVRNWTSRVRRCASRWAVCSACCPGLTHDRAVVDVDPKVGSRALRVSGLEDGLPGLDEGDVTGLWWVGPEPSDRARGRYYFAASENLDGPSPIAESRCTARGGGLGACSDPAKKGTLHLGNAARR